MNPDSSSRQPCGSNQGTVSQQEPINSHIYDKEILKHFHVRLLNASDEPAFDFSNQLFVTLSKWPYFTTLHSQASTPPLRSWLSSNLCVDLILSRPLQFHFERLAFAILEQSRKHFFISLIGSHSFPQ